MDAILERSARHVAWRSVTGGDSDGVMLRLDAPPTAILSFRSPPASFDVSLAEIENGTWHFPAGLVDAQVVIAHPPTDPLPSAMSFEYVDTSVRSGAMPTGCVSARPRMSGPGAARCTSSRLHRERVPRHRRAID